MVNEISNPVNLLMIVIGSFLGLSLGLYLIFSKSRNGQANIFLGLLLLTSLTYFGQGFLYRFGLLEKFPHIIGTSHFATLILGPLTYFYVRSCIQKNFRLKGVLWLHFLPVGILILIYHEFLLQSAEDKVLYFHKMLQTGEIIAGKLESLLKCMTALGYFLWSFYLIYNYKKHLTNVTSFIDNTFHNWVVVFIMLHLIPILTISLCFVFLPFGTNTLLFVFLGYFFFNIAVFLAILSKPELFRTFPHQMLSTESNTAHSIKYESSNLQEQQKDVYKKKLVQYVELNKSYLEPELTLNQLAEKTEINSHYVSQIINEKLNCNFLEFINSYRIDEVKEKLADPKFDHYTIIAIAYECGFNSKSAFYEAFKKKVGSTPSAYRRSFRA